MDKEQAIDLLDNLIGMIEDNQDNDYDTAFRMAIEALKAQLFLEGTTSEQPVATDIYVGDKISRQAVIDALDCINGVEEVLRSLPSAQPNRELIDDYMWKIKQNISPHTAADGVIAIKYYLEQIYEQIYGKGEKPKWMI